MHLTRESLQNLAELVDEAKQGVQDARLAEDDEVRRKKLDLAEKSLREIASLMADEVS